MPDSIHTATHRKEVLFFPQASLKEKNAPLHPLKAENPNSSLLNQKVFNANDRTLSRNKRDISSYYQLLPILPLVEQGLITPKSCAELLPEIEASIAEYNQKIARAKSEQESNQLKKELNNKIYSIFSLPQSLRVEITLNYQNNDEGLNAALHKTIGTLFTLIDEAKLSAEVLNIVRDLKKDYDSQKTKNLTNSLEYSKKILKTIDLLIQKFDPREYVVTDFIGDLHSLDDTVQNEKRLIADISKKFKELGHSRVKELAPSFNNLDAVRSRIQLFQNAHIKPITTHYLNALYNSLNKLIKWPEADQTERSKLLNLLKEEDQPELQLFQSLVSNTVMPNSVFNISDFPPQCYIIYGQNNSINICRTYKPVGALIHELGHHSERFILEYILAYRKTRCTKQVSYIDEGDKTAPYMQCDWEQKGGSFNTGKIYQDANGKDVATEFVSTMIHRFFMDPVQLIKTDWSSLCILIDGLRGLGKIKK